MVGFSRGGLCAGAATAFSTAKSEVLLIVRFNFWVSLQKRVSRVIGAGEGVGVWVRGGLG